MQSLKMKSKVPIFCTMTLSSWVGWIVQRTPVPLSSRSQLQMAQSPSVTAMLSSGSLSQHHCHQHHFQGYIYILYVSGVMMAMTIKLSPY